MLQLLIRLPAPRERLFVLLLAVLPLSAPAVRGEEAAALKAKGVSALKASANDSRSLIEAAKLFAKASEMFEQAGNAEEAVETNSYLYWCKKKMTLQDIEEFNRADGESAKRLEKVVTQTAPPEDSKAWLSRAEAFARANPAEHLLIAIRYYEVADRFRGSDEGYAALDRSLKEMQLTSTKAALPPIPPRPTQEAKQAVNGKTPLPDAARSKEAVKLIRETLKAEYSGAKAEEKTALVKKLMETASGSPAGSAEKYEAYREARDQSLLIGGSSAAVAASDALHQEFAMDPAESVAALQRVTTGRSEEHIVFAASMLAISCAERQMEAGQHDKLKALAPIIQGLAGRLPAGRLYAPGLKAQLTRITEILKEWAACQAALAKLEKDPNDPAANQAAGRFFCLTQENWTRGLPLLARGSDAGVKAAAERELAQPATPAEQIAAADAWSEAAKKMTPAAKRVVEVHAGAWYEKALPAAGGLDKVRIEKRIAEIRAGDPPPIIPPVVVALAKYGTEDKNIDVTAHYQKEFDNDPFAVIYGSAIPWKDVAPGKGKKITCQLLIDGNMETASVSETGVYVPTYLKNGVKVSNPGFKLLRAKVSAPNAWLDRTEYALPLLKDENASVVCNKVWEAGKPYDPWPYVTKKLIVWYELGGKRYARVFESGSPVYFR